MSMLADWFFCTTMRLSPADTHAFLDTLSVLQRPEPNLLEVLDAAAALDSAPPWLQLYALRPLLTAHGRLADHAADEADDGTGPGPDDVPEGYQAAGGGRRRPEDGAAGSAYGDAELARRIERLGDAVLSSTDHPLAAVVNSVLAAVLRDDEAAGTALVRDIALPLAEESPRPAGATVSTPYHDLNDHIVPTVAVIALAELTRRRPSSTMQVWLGENSPTMVAAALRGEHGRLALLAAVEAAGRADPEARDEIWRRLWLDGRGAPQLQPDLLDALARLWFGQPDSDSPPSVAALETEAITGDDLALWAAYRRPDPTATEDFYALLTGHANGAWEAMAAALWQSVLWSLAAEVDPIETAARLARWWQAPRRTPGKPNVVHVGRNTPRAAYHLTLLQQMSFAPGSNVVVDDAPVEQTTPHDGAAVCTPWMYRWHDGWVHGRKDGPVFRPGSSGSAEPLLRLLAAADLAVRLLAEPRVGSTDPDHLTALVFHAVDVIRDHAALLNALESGEYTGEHPLGQAFVSCLWHVQLVLERTGTGADDRIDPALLASFALRVLDEGSTADLHGNEQFARLSRQSLSAIATIWIRLAWVRSSTRRPGQGTGRWFLDDPPHALRVLMSALDRLSVLDVQHRQLSAKGRRRRAQIDREWAQRPQTGSMQRKPDYGVALTRGLRPPDLMPPAQLLREIYPKDWPDPVADRWQHLKVDWYADRKRLRTNYAGLLREAKGDPDAVVTNTVRPDRLLLSPVYPLQTWRESTADLEQWTRVAGAPITMRALRLATLLQEPAAAASDGYREWIEDWLDRIYAVNQENQLPLDVRAIMIRLLGSVPADRAVDYERRLASVYEATVDAILEFGASTPRHVEMLLERLGGALALGRENTDRLRLRALETIYRQRRYRGGRLHLGNPFDLREERNAAGNREIAIRQFLDAIADPPDDPSERIPVLERARALWERTQLRPLLRGSRTPLTERRRERAAFAPAPQLLIAAAVTDWFRAQEIAYLLDVISPAAPHPSGREARIHDLFPSVNYRRRILAQLATASRTAFAIVVCTEGDRVWLNAGLGHPVAYDAAAEDPDLTPGDVVAAQLRGDQARVVGVRRPPRPEPEPDEVRTATVRSHSPWLTVEIDGVPAGVYPTGDGTAAETVRRRWDPDLSRVFTSAAETSLTVPARWDASLQHWVPVERTLSELIMDEARLTSGIRLVHAGEELFVTRPGRLYRLPAADWQDPAAVTAALERQSGGLILHVSRVAAGEPRLHLTGSDDRNVRWLRLFSSTDNEFTVATKDERGFTVTVDPPDGFPDTVRVRGAEGGAHRAYVITAPWDDRQARRPEVTVTLVPVSGVADRERPTPGRFDEMSSIAKEMTVTLHRIFSNTIEDALVWATTKAGFAVRLETDSLTLLNPHAVGKTATGFVNGRRAEVIRVHARPAGPAGRAMSDQDLADKVHTDGADPEDVGRTVAAAQTLDGVVVARASASGRGGDTMYGTWCRFAETVHFVELDHEDLGGTTAQLVGQTFAGTRDGDAWTFRFTPREITVRALFEIREADEQRQQAFVGTAGSVDLYQQLSLPVLVRRPTSTSDVVRRLNLAAAGVTLIDRRPNSTRTVAVRQGGDVWLGGAQFRGNPVDARISRVYLRISPFGSGRDGLVHVRRSFVLTARTATSPQPVQVDHAGRWRQFAATGQDHITGTLTGTHIEVAGGLRPPGPDGTQSARLPRRPGEEPAVAGVPYRSIGARVRLVPDGDGFVGSFATATPKSVPEFINLMHQEVTADGPPRTFADALYYVGPPTEDFSAHLFEWGYGWTVAVPADRLRVAGTPDRGGLPPLFHGDQVSAAAFVPAADGGDPVMVIAWRDIRHRYVTQIVEERGRKYLHLLDLEIGVAAGTVRVLRAQAGRRRGDDPFRSAEWVPFQAAMDETSMALLFQQLRDAGETGLVRRRVLARFDNDKAISTGGRTRLFHAVRAGGVGLENNDRVFLTARRIEETANELTVIFGIPDALNADDLAVRVNRREFSFRENTLARLIGRGLDVESAEVVMLVRLLDSDRRGVRYGSIKDAPARQPETLISYLASRGGACYAVFGRVGRSEGRLEIAPGVLYSTNEVAGAEDAEHGAVVRLVLDGVRRVSLTTALPADGSYIGAAGRAAVVFPKSTLLRKQSAERNGDMRRAFVVSGLPDVQVSPVPGAGPEVLAASHPKISRVLRATDGTYQLRLATPSDARIARLARPDPGRAAAVRPRPLPGQPRDDQLVTVPWARMSFQNASASSIAKNCAEFDWKHHDRLTGQVVGDRVVGPYKVPPGSLASDGALFDDDAGWTLRYPPDRLAAFGFPAGELLDMPKLCRSFAVAGPSLDGGGIWIEVGPSRLVEIRGALVTADGRTALTDLDWSAFTPGDQIGIRSTEDGQDSGSWEASQGHLVLTSWRPSVAGALPRTDREARILLPVSHVDMSGGALDLAARRWRMVYPVAQAEVEEFKGVGAVWLNARNDIEPFADGSLRPGDTALLSADEDGRLALAGSPGMEVRVARGGERHWPGYDWIHHALTQESHRYSILTALDQQLPVTVYTVGIDRPVVTVTREHQPPGHWPRGRQVRTELLAAWADQWLLLRSGGALYKVHVREAVAGTPAALATPVAAALSRHAAEAPLVLWWVVDQDGTRQAGLVATAVDAPAHDVAVVPELEVALDGLAVGVVCRDVATAKLYWLDARHASWVRDVAEGDLLTNLARTGQLASRIRPDGSLSINARPAVSHQLRRLHLGQQLRMVLGVGTPKHTEDGRWRYLARLEVPPVLASYVSTDRNHTAGASRLTEVDELDRLGQPSVTTVDVHSRLVTLDLPEWLLQAHQSISSGGTAENDRFERYRHWYREGLVGGAAADDPVEGVLRLAGDLAEEGAEVDPAQVLVVVNRWLDAHGEAVFNLTGQVEVDAAPLLAGALTLDALTGTHPTLERATVLGLHQIGRRAAASLHTEQIAVAWIGRPDRHSLGGAWVRLRSLTLARELGTREMRQLREFCRAMLAKPALRIPEHALAPIARSLLASVGDLESAEDLLRDAAFLGGPAAWARTLLPPAGHATAQPRLLPPQRTQLYTLAESVISDAVPLTLLPVVAPPNRSEQDLIRKFLRDIRQTARRTD